MIKILVRCALCGKVLKKYVQKQQKYFNHCGTRQEIKGKIIEGESRWKGEVTDEKTEKKEEIKQEIKEEKSNNNDKPKEKNDWEW